MESGPGICMLFGVMVGMGLGIACEAIAGARERRHWRERMADAELAAYAAGLDDGRRSARAVTLGAEVEDDRG